MISRPEDILLDTSVWSRSDGGRSRPNGALSAVSRPDEGTSISLSRPDDGLSMVSRPDDILLEATMWLRSDGGRSRPNGALSAVSRPDEGTSISLSRPDDGLSMVSRPDDILLGVSFSSLTNGTRLDGILSYHIDVVPSSLCCSSSVD